jgi:hypothetical protein
MCSRDVENRCAHPSYRCTGGKAPPSTREVRMKYLLLVYGDETAFEAADPESRKKMYEAFGTVANDLTAKGQLLAGDELAPTTSATTVRQQGEAQLVTDGPFAETKEQLGGYFLVDVPDLDEAIAVAKRIPSPSVEIRPLVEGP